MLYDYAHYSTAANFVKPTELNDPKKTVDNLLVLAYIT